MTDERLIGFPPVYAKDARVLILGSMPSVESLRQNFYYAHPRNIFWPMLAGILGEPLPDCTEAKKEMLIRHRIALWDTAQSCVRIGSLDSAIRDPRANDFEALYARCPQITRVLFNGAAAMNLYLKLVGNRDGRILVRLPSTSPAYTLSYSEKERLWKDALKEALQDDNR